MNQAALQPLEPEQYHVSPADLLPALCSQSLFMSERTQYFIPICLLSGLGVDDTTVSVFLVFMNALSVPI